MTDTTIRDHLAAQLVKTAGNLERDGTLPASEIATAFVTVGTAIAASHIGGVSAAEWLRDLADAIERGDPRLNVTIQ